MKKTSIYLVLSALLCTTASCEKEEATTAQLCAPTAKTVKTITNASGIVYFNTMLMHYVISVHQPGTTDAVDLGIVCGNLPAALQIDGTRVTVSGALKEYGQPAPAPVPAGYTYYYLEVASIQ